MSVSRRVRNVRSRCGGGQSQRRTGGVPERKSTKPVVILAYPKGLDGSNLKEQLSSLFSQQSLNPDPDVRTSVSGKDGQVSIVSLKEFAKNRLARDSSLLEVLLAEPDELEVNAFLAKVGIWLRLLRREGG